MGELNDTSSERDVIEKLKESVEKTKRETKAILAGLGDGISIQDRDFKIIYQNEVMQKIMGNQIGKYCYNAYEKRDQVCEKCPIEIALKTGQINTSLRVGINKYGESGYFENTASPIRNKKGEIIAAVEIVRDVSDRVRLEDDVKDRTTELAQANMNLRKLRDELEQKVKERTAELEKSKEELQGKLVELEKFTRVTVGREQRIIDLKREVEDLRKK